MDFLTFILIVMIIGVISIAVYQKYYAHREEDKHVAVKKAEIIARYKRQIDVALEPYTEEDGQAMAKFLRKDLLKKFNKELSMNIFFDGNEIKKVLEELANYNNFQDK